GEADPDAPGQVRRGQGLEPGLGPGDEGQPRWGEAQALPQLFEEAPALAEEKGGPEDGPRQAAGPDQFLRLPLGVRVGVARVGRGPQRAHQDEAPGPGRLGSGQEVAGALNVDGPVIAVPAPPEDGDQVDDRLHALAGGLQAARIPHVAHHLLGLGAGEAGEARHGRLVDQGAYRQALSHQLSDDGPAHQACTARDQDHCMCPSSSAARGRPFSEPEYPVLGSRPKGRPGFALGQKAGLLAGEGEDSGNGGPYGRGPAGGPTAGKARRRIPAGGRGPYDRGSSCRTGSPYRSGSITTSPSLSRRTRTHSTSCSTLRLALPMRRWTLGRIRRAWSTPSSTNSSVVTVPASAPTEWSSTRPDWTRRDPPMSWALGARTPSRA